MNKFNLGKKPIWIFLVAILLLAIFLVFNYYLDYMAFKEIGSNFIEVFLTNLKAKVVAQIISFLLVLLIIYLSFVFLRRNLVKIDSSFNFLKKKYFILILSFVFSLIVSSIVQSTVYERLLLFLNPIYTNIGDPIFFKDIGYYMFQRPFLISLFDSLIGIFVFVTIAIFIIYIFLYLRLGITNIGEIFKVKGIAIHNLINLSMIILIKAISYLFKAEEVLFSQTGAVNGAGYTEVNVWKLYYRVIPFILIALVLIAIILLYKNKLKYSILTIAVYPITYIAFLAVAMFTQTFIVKPQELTMEAPYIAYNINYTKMAYDLSDIEQKEFPISYNLQKKDLEKEKNTLSNVRIIDYPSTLKTINQVQGIRNFYSFHDLDIVKYDINNEPTAVTLAAREFNKENLDPTAKNFLNEKLRFTHGYGVVASHVNQVNSEGQPAFLIKDIPPTSVEGMPQVTQPRIYFGEMTNDYVFVNSGYKELDYSSGETDVEYSYEGKAGIKMNLGNKILYSIYYGDFQLFISKLVNKDSKLLLNRNVVERVKKVATFLTVDTDPYILVDDEGKLKWIVNCYTTSSYYPYSKPISFNGENINYIRESIKAVVDAYDGTVQFYITDESDPVAQSYKKIYPSFFEQEQMPTGLSAHLQFPEPMFKIQSEIYKKYHIDNTNIFYNKTDVWDYAKEKYQNETKYISPYYSLMSLFGDQEELTLLIPYTMVNKDNLVGWLGVSSDPDHYGRMVLYTFPKGENVYGTLQIENKIDNDPTISREMTLWGQGGSSVIRGNMLVVPIANSLLYVEPLYISSGNESSLPELKRVIVAYKDKIVMAETFDKAILSLFNYQLEPNLVLKETPTEIQDVDVQKNLQSQKNIVDLFDKIKKSMSESNWKDFGESFDKLEQEIGKVRDSMNSSGQNTTANAPEQNTAE